MTAEPADLASTRAAYDRVAADYADLLREELAGKPLDRAVLGAFAEHVVAAGGGPVADLGCGPGRIAAHVAGLGLAVRGLDLSPGMVEVARRDHPGLAFEVGSMLALPYADAELAGALAWYSVIHIPQADQDALFAEFARAVRPAGWLLLAFQVSEEADEDVVRVRHAYGHDLDLRTRRQRPARIRQRLTAAGFAPVAELIREPAAPERTRQAFVLAQRVVASTESSST